MKKYSFLGCVSLCLLIAAGCSNDANEGIKTSCGDGVLNNDEICDGTEFAEGVKVCPDGLVLKNAEAFACTATCGLDFTKACAAPTCGDGELSGAELCDGDKFRDAAKLCPAGMEEVEEPVYTCTETCLIDISQACRVKNAGTCNPDDQCDKCENLCGNGQLDEGEICDGDDFADGVQVCPDGTTEMDGAIFGCTDKCLLDVSAACAPNEPNLCGNGQLDEGEICDGEAFADDAQVCPAGTTAKENPVFACTAQCQLDVSAACDPNELVKCGDGELSGDEVCDGDKFAEGAKACPGDMVELENPVYACTDKCQIDISGACVSSICGDGKVTGQEVCDGDVFAEGAKVCPGDMVVIQNSNRDLFACNEYCALDTTYACRDKNANDPILYISELRMINDNEDAEKVNHFYIEIGNLGVATPLSDCKLVGVNLDPNDNTKIDSKFAFEYPLEGVLGNSASEPSSVLGICHERTDGWVKQHYDEETLTAWECLSIYNYAKSAYYECQLACEGSEDCLKWCSNDFEDDYKKCNDKVNYKFIDDSCDIYIPASDTNLNLTRTRSTYKSDKFWGLGVVCSDWVHDIVRVFDMPNSYHGAVRVCEKSDDLTSIKPTGDKILKSDPDEYYGSKANPIMAYSSPTSMDVAKCGYNVFN